VCSMAELTSTIDWISGTFALPEQANRFIFWLEPDNKFKECKPRFGYEFGCEYTSGMVVFQSTKRAEMGTHVIMSGSTLAHYIKSGIAVLSILEKFVTNRAKVTRLDLALDLIDGGIDGQEIYKALQEGDKNGIASRFSMVLSDNAGCTLYFGSRQSERFARLYNKGAEQNNGLDWWRFEVECKGDVAKEYARVLVMADRPELGDFTWSTIRRMVSTTRGGFMGFGDNLATVGLPKIEKTSDTKKWIIEQVVPAVTNYLREHPDDLEVLANIEQILYDVQHMHGEGSFDK
jgi:Replication initiation factor